MPLGFSQDVGQPAALLVRRDVLAGAGASSVEAHAADPGSVLRVCQRGEGWPRRPPDTGANASALGDSTHLTLNVLSFYKVVMRG